MRGRKKFRRARRTGPGWVRSAEWRPLWLGQDGVQSPLLGPASASASTSTPVVFSAAGPVAGMDRSEIERNGLRQGRRRGVVAAQAVGSARGLVRSETSNATVGTAEGAGGVACQPREIAKIAEGCDVPRLHLITWPADGPDQAGAESYTWINTISTRHCCAYRRPCAHKTTAR